MTTRHGSSSTITDKIDAYLYTRVSEDRTGIGRSTEEQEAEGRKVIDAEGWTLAGVYTDNDRSASRYATKARPDWDRLNDDLAVPAGRRRVLVLWESSRGSRDPEVWFAFLAACRRHGVLVHVISHRRTYDLSVAREWKTLAEDGIDNAYETEKTSERVQRAMLANAIAGKPHGRIPYGYRRRYAENGVRRAVEGQDIDPETAPVVRDIFTRLATGEALSRIANSLNERGLPSPGADTWTRQMVRRIGLNRAYIGEREHAGQVYPAMWEAIVPADEFYTVQRVLSAPGRKTTRPGGTKHLLSYLATCDPCGAPLSASPARGYFCSRAGHVTAPIALVDDAVVASLLRKFEEEPVLDRFAAIDEVAVAHAREEVAALRDRLDRLRDKVIAGVLEPEDFAYMRAALVPTIEAAEHRAAEVAVPVGMRGLLGPGLIKEKWQNLPIGAKRNIIATMADVRLLHATTRRRDEPDLDRVRIDWKA